MMESRKILRLLCAFGCLLLFAGCLPAASDQAPDLEEEVDSSGTGGDPDPDTTPTGPEWRCDVNGDGSVSLADAELAFAFVSEASAPTIDQFRQADVSPISDPDGDLDQTDVEILMRAVNGEDALCFIPGTPQLVPNHAAYEWQPPATLGVGAPYFPPGPFIDVTQLPTDCSDCVDAVADGVTNDAPAISRAIEYACVNGISNIYIPAGEYAIGPPTGGSSFSGIGYETYICPGTVEIFGDGESTVLMPNSTVGNYLLQVCYDWGNDILDGNANKSGVICDLAGQVYVPSSRLVVHDMTWYDPDPTLHSSQHIEESHGLKTAATLGSLEVYNITVIDIGDEAIDLSMHIESYAHLHHNEFYGVPSVGGGSAYAAYRSGIVIFENSIIDTLSGNGASSRWGSCFDINPNSMPGRPLREIVIRDNWCRGRRYGAKIILSGNDDESIDWLQITGNYLEVAPHRIDAATAASIRLRPNAMNENGAYILGGLISNNELYGRVLFDTDGIFDLAFDGNSVRQVKQIRDQRGIAAATATNPVVIQASHALEDGQEVNLLNVHGQVELNGRRFTVANSVPGNSGSFELVGEDGSGRTPGVWGAVEFEQPHYRMDQAEVVESDPPRIRMKGQNRLAVGDLIETSGLDTFEEIAGYHFRVTAVANSWVEFEVDREPEHSEDNSPDMRIWKVADGPGVLLRGRRISFTNNTVSGFADGCIEFYPFELSPGDSCEDGASHTIEMTIESNDFDCDGGQWDAPNYIIERPLWGTYCSPDAGETGNFSVTGNTFLVRDPLSHARGALSLLRRWLNVRFDENRIYRPSSGTDGRAVYIAEADDAVVARNEIRWAGEGVMLRNLDGALVEDNKIEQFGTGPYFDSGVTLHGVIGATVSQNTVCGSRYQPSEGVRVISGAANVLVANELVPAGCFNAP